MRARTFTPEAPEHRMVPQTPHDTGTRIALRTLLRQNIISPGTAFEKMEKGFQMMEAERLLLAQDIERRQAAEELDRAARASRKRTRFPQGNVFDEGYADAHAEGLASRKAGEEDRRCVQRNVAARGKRRARAATQTIGAGPSNTMHED